MPDAMKIMAATEPADVATLAMIETLRQISDTMKGLQTEQREDRKLLLQVKDDVTVIKSNEVNRRVKALEDRVDKLESAEDHRTGAVTALGTLWKQLPTIAAIIVGIAIIVVAVLKLRGVVP